MAVNLLIAVSSYSADGNNFGDHDYHQMRNKNGHESGANGIIISNKVVIQLMRFSRLASYCIVKHIQIAIAS